MVLSDADLTDKEALAVANMVRFVRESLEEYGSTTIPYARINALIGSEDGSVKGVYELPDYIADSEYPDVDANISALSEYIYSINFQLRDAYAAYVFTKTDKAIAAKATISVTTSAGDMGLRDNTADSKAPWTLNLRVYDAINTMTVKVHIPELKNDNGEVIQEAQVLSATYSIGSYINATDSDLARALYAFGAAARDYRNSRKDY